MPQPPALKPWDASRVSDSDEDVVVAHNWLELRTFMWDYVGIVRTSKRLLRAQHRVDLLKREIIEFYRNYRITHHLIELRNLVTVAELIVRSALERRESRGLHYTLDFPQTEAVAQPTVLHAVKPLVAYAPGTKHAAVGGPGLTLHPGAGNGMLPRRSVGV